MIKWHESTRKESGNKTSTFGFKHFNFFFSKIFWDRGREDIDERVDIVN